MAASELLLVWLASTLLTTGVAGAEDQLGTTGGAGAEDQLGTTGGAGAEDQLGTTGGAGAEDQLGTTGGAGAEDQLGTTGGAGAEDQLGTTGGAGAEDQLGTTGGAGAEDQLLTTGVAGAEDQLLTTGVAGAEDQLLTTGVAGAEDQLGTTGGAGAEDQLGTTGGAGAEDQLGTTGGAGAEDQLGTTGGAGAEDQLGTTGGAGAEDQLGTTEGLVVDCSNKTLHFIPSNYSATITKLILSNNLIELSQPDGPALNNYPNLIELHLDSNWLTDLPGKLFEAMSKLEVLNLSHNNISRVEPKALAGLVNLRELDLSYNRLQSLPLHLLDGLGKLAILRLGGNALRELDISMESNPLKELDLKENPWNCSCVFLNKIKSITDSNVQIRGSNATCASPEVLAGKGILDNSVSCSSGSSSSTTTTTVPPPTTHSTTKPTSAPNTTQSALPAVTTNASLVFKSVDPGSGSGVPVVGNTWKFLLGVVAIALTTSMLIVCAVKSPSWYKLLFDYRHQRLRDEEDADVYTTGRYSSFSLDTEQMETSAYELDHEQDGSDNEEDGYIEDRYIEPGVYEDNTEP